MNSLSRAALAASHLAVLGLGVVAGIEVRANRQATADPDVTEPPAPATSSGRSGPATAAPPYATAWETLKDRSLSRDERLAIQRALLGEWSMTDLEAALHAVLGERPRDQDDLLAECSPGILAHRAQAWDLITSRAFGWETARLRSLWIGLMAVHDPDKLFPKLRELPPSDRIDALQRLAGRWWDLEDAALREKIWSGLEKHVATADGETFANVAQWLGGSRPVEDLLPALQRGTTAAERRLAAASVGLALDALEAEEFDREFARLPEELRPEIAAAALAADDSGIGLTLPYARLALDAGHLDDLAAAASRDGFRIFSEETEDPGALLEWAFSLPDDPRLTRLYRQAIRGSDRVSFGEIALESYEADFDQLLAKVEALPPGWKRDEGLAVLAPLGLHRGKTRQEILALLEQIGSPGLRDEATGAYREQFAEEDERGDE